MKDFLTFEPIMPLPEDIRGDRMIISYDEDADILIVHFFGIRPGVMLDVSDHVLLCIDPVSHEVVGLQIEAYLLATVRTQPWLRDLAGATDAPQRVLWTSVDQEFHDPSEHQDGEGNQVQPDH